jgi:hypothetical protein
MTYERSGSIRPSGALRTPEALADALLGRLNAQHARRLIDAFGPILTRRHLSATIPEGPMRDYVLALAQSNGFAILGTRKV